MASTSCCSSFSALSSCSSPFVPLFSYKVSCIGVENQNAWALEFIIVDLSIKGTVELSIAQFSIGIRSHKPEIRVEKRRLPVFHKLTKRHGLVAAFRIILKMC
ncbi:hypothetical protein Adt_41412 [Abeliophyllum distichum]|uniref:Uncharacterized protein n=1 Tax=Abeliophyllum distichum TaxID=126358 RepID=A0ABD1PNS0_9LAMI